jgi:hypothetical protein
MRTDMEIMHEKSYEDMQITLLMLPNEKSCAGELIWGHEKTMKRHMLTHGNYLWELIWGHYSLRVPVLMVPNEKSYPSKFIWWHKKKPFSMREHEIIRTHSPVLIFLKLPYMLCGRCTIANCIRIISQNSNRLVGLL